MVTSSLEAEELVEVALLPEMSTARCAIWQHSGGRDSTYWSTWIGLSGPEVPAGCAGGNSVDVGVSRESLGTGAWGILGN